METTTTAVATLSEEEVEEAAQDLVTAARTLFTERGYRQTSFEDLAEEARLELEFARGLYPDKAAVFAALVERTVKVAGLLAPAVAEGIDDDLPLRLARAYYGLWEPTEEGGDSPLVELYRVALSDREASEILRVRSALALNGQVDSALPGSDARLRTAVFGAFVGGTALCRHLLGVEPVASADLDELLAMMAPGLRATLLGGHPNS